MAVASPSATPSPGSLSVTLKLLSSAGVVRPCTTTLKLAWVSPAAMVRVVSSSSYSTPAVALPLVVATCTLVPPLGAAWFMVMVNGMATSPVPCTLMLLSAIDSDGPMATQGLVLLCGWVGLTVTKSALLSPVFCGRPAAVCRRR